MVRQKSSIIIIVISILLGLSGLLKVIASIPLYTLYTSIQRGGSYNQLDQIRIEKVNTLSPAANAGLETGDMLVSVNGNIVHKTEEFTNIVNHNRGVSIEIVIKRNGVLQNVTLIPKVNNPPNEGAIGVTISNQELKKEPIFVLIPGILFNAYSGKEYALDESPLITLNPSYTQTLYRLRTLIAGIVQIIIAVGLLKLKRWGLYAFLVLGILNLYNLGQLLFTGFFHQVQPNMIEYIILIIELLFALYIFSQRRCFK